MRSPQGDLPPAGFRGRAQAPVYPARKRENLSWESAERRYYRHLKRIHEVFGVSQVGLLWRGDAVAERFRSDIRPFRLHPAKGTKQ